MKKLLFPPIVPNSLPAFDYQGILKYYFKPSIANSIEQIKHLQMTIVRLDTNRTILNSTQYPFEIIFKNSSEIFKDEEKGFWYVEIPATTFPVADIPYKIQIRLGETPIENKTEAELGLLLKDFDKMSEWSIVTMVMPITIPTFGVQSFDDSLENRVTSTGYVFSGYYESQDPNRQETLRSFRYNLYSGNVDDKTTWKLLSTSGEQYIGISDKLNLSYTFPYELKEEGKFIVTMTIKTKNLYTDTKVYRVYSAAYPILEMFNSIEVVPNSNEAKMDITIRPRQILINPSAGTNIKYIKDEPGNNAYPNLTATHAKITGSIYSKDNFSLVAKDGIWICQFKAMFKNVLNSIKEVESKPMIEILQDTALPWDSNYYTKIKIGCMKINLSYPTSTNKSPAPEWEYRFIVRKEVLVKMNGIETVVLSQNKVIRSSEPIDPKQEYYFYIIEKNGSLDVEMQKTYLSTNTEI